MGCYAPGVIQEEIQAVARCLPWRLKSDVNRGKMQWEPKLLR